MAPEPHKRVVLVLGASGKIGRMLRAVWRETPAQDIEFAYVHRNRSRDHQGIVWRPGEPLNHFPKVHALVALWGATPRSGYAFSDNTDLAKATLELAAALQVERVLHFSSSAIYPASSKPQSEANFGPAPNAYGQSKLDMEHLIATWASENENRFSNVVLRLANVAGADALFSNIKPGGTVTLDRFPDGLGPRRSYIGAVDLAKVIEALIDAKSVQGAINVAAPCATDMAGLAKAAKCNISWKPAPSDAIASVTLDTGKLQSVLRLDEVTASPQHLVECAQKGGLWP